MSDDIKLLEPYLLQIRNAISIAKERKKEQDEEFARKDTDGDGIVHERLCIGELEDLIPKGKEKELIDYLNTLDYEVIKILQVIMYIGRDCSCIEEDGTYSYIKTRKNFDLNGWNVRKEIEVSQMTDKCPLYEYWVSGCEKLGIVY